jgi:hypothetical protein
MTRAFFLASVIMILGGTILGILCLLAPGLVLLACDCTPIPASEGLASPEIESVFLGKLLSAEEILIPLGPGTIEIRAFRASFRPRAIWKGPVSETVTLLTPQEGTACGLDLTRPGDYLVLAYRLENGLWANSCSASWVREGSAMPAELGEPLWSAATFVVDLHGTGDFTDIQPALDAAKDGDLVLVKPGEYLISEPINFNRDRNPDDPASPPPKNIVVKSESGPEVTTIRMSDAPAIPDRTSVVIFENGEGAESRLEGFTLTGGKGTGTPTPSWKWHNGGGVYCDRSSPALINCTIAGNWAEEGYGGGLYCGDHASPILTNCTISENSAVFGGGVYCVGSPIFIRCTLMKNWGLWGGGIYCVGDSSPILTSCAITRNIGEYDGGGVYCSEQSLPVLTASVISANYGVETGGGLFCSGSSSPTLTNCEIWGNWGLEVGGGLLSTEDSSPALMNCTITGNLADLGGGVSCRESSSPMLTNCIVWGNITDYGNVAESMCGQASHCLEDRDPLFLNPGRLDFNREILVNFLQQQRHVPDFIVEAPDYHLQPNSPAIDAGTSAGAPVTDFEGHPRPCGEGIDLGAYEYCPAAARVLAIRPMQVAAGQPANVWVLLSSPDGVQAFSLGVAHEPSAVRLTGIDFQDCPVMEALNGGAGPDFFEVDLEAGVSGCGNDVTAGGTVACVVSREEPATSVIPPGSDKPIVRLSYEPVNPAAVSTSALRIVGCLGDHRPLPVVLTIDFASVTPQVEDGSITIEAPGPRFVRGDANSDARIDISDTVTVLGYLFQGEGPLTCQKSGDANDDGSLDLSDAIAILMFLFLGGDPLPPPSLCGQDATPDGLTCALFGSCS